jgi:hypothetical protein
VLNHAPERKQRHQSMRFQMAHDFAGFNFVPWTTAMVGRVAPRAPDSAHDRQDASQLETTILVLGIWGFFGFLGLGFGDSAPIRTQSVFHPWLL